MNHRGFVGSLFAGMLGAIGVKPAPAKTTSGIPRCLRCGKLADVSEHYFFSYNAIAWRCLDCKVLGVFGSPMVMRMPYKSGSGIRWFFTTRWSYQKLQLEAMRICEDGSATKQYYASRHRRIPYE